VCMKPCSQSGTSSSFYAFSGFFDSKRKRSPDEEDAHFHNEVDIEVCRACKESFAQGVTVQPSRPRLRSGSVELAANMHSLVPLDTCAQFVGQNTSRMQTNYYSRHGWRVDPAMDQGSGLEAYHDLGFDAAADFHAYTIRWASWGLQWYVGSKLVRTVLRAEDPGMPDPAYGPLRIAANVWVADESAQGWTGKLAHDFSRGVSEYAWVKFDGGDDCRVQPDCGF
jgi:hypothetical protein